MVSLERLKFSLVEYEQPNKICLKKMHFVYLYFGLYDTCNIVLSKPTLAILLYKISHSCVLTSNVLTVLG